MNRLLKSNASHSLKVCLLFHWAKYLPKSSIRTSGYRLTTPGTGRFMETIWDLCWEQARAAGPTSSPWSKCWYYTILLALSLSSRTFSFLSSPFPLSTTPLSFIFPAYDLSLPMVVTDIGRALLRMGTQTQKDCWFKFSPQRLRSSMFS